VTHVVHAIERADRDDAQESLAALRGRPVRYAATDIPMS
jgi:hypothetical protein